MNWRWKLVPKASPSLASGGSENFLAKHGNQRERSDGNLTEKNEAGERGEGRRERTGAGGVEEGGIVDQPLARSHGSAAGSPAPKVFSHWIHHFITGSWRF